MEANKNNTQKELEAKDYKFAYNILSVIALFFSMIYACAVDSFSNFEILAYGAIIGGMWYLVSKLYEKSKIEE